jgi:hypothetical protein
MPSTPPSPHSCPHPTLTPPPNHPHHPQTTPKGPFIREVALPNQAAPGLTLAVAPEQPAEVRLLRPAVLLGAGEMGDDAVRGGWRGGGARGAG